MLCQSGSAPPPGRNEPLLAGLAVPSILKNPHLGTVPWRLMNYRMDRLNAIPRSPLPATTLMLQLGFLLVAFSASADPAETLGISWEGRGSAGAAAAGVDTYAAAFYNPANLGYSPSITADAGFLVAWDGLTSDQGNNGGSYLELGVQLPVLLHKSHPIWMGLGLLTPTTGFYDIDLSPVGQPTYLPFNSRERRLSFAAALGARLFPWLSIGLGAQMLPDVTAKVSLDLAQATGDNDVSVRVGYRLTPTAGVSIRPIPALKVGLSYRGAIDTRLDLPVDVVAEGIVLEALVSSRTYFVPHRITLGAEWTFSKQLRLEVDGQWSKYSDMDSPSPSVALYDSEGTDTLGAIPPGPFTRDTVSVASALRYRGPLELVAAYSFVPSVVEKQSGPTNYLDCDRHTLALGGRVPLVRGKGIPSGLFLWATVQGSWMVQRTFYKDELLVDNPGYPSIEAGGWRASASLGIELVY